MDQGARSTTLWRSRARGALVRLQRAAVAEQRTPSRLVRHRVDRWASSVMGVKGVERRQRISYVESDRGGDHVRCGVTTD
jgi:hypothetical protein